MVDILAAPQQAKTNTAKTGTAKSDTALRTLTAISVAHWVSHFHLFVLPMLFPFLKEQLGVGYIELGFALTIFGVVSGLTQAPIGYLADHIGARKVLLVGLTVGGLALIMLGLHLSYISLIVCAALLGLANSVYHPCDYAILSTHMDEARMGRAFSIHTFAGFLGGAVAPAIMAALVAAVGGLGALIVAGAVGPLVALLLIAVRIPDASSADRKADGAPAQQQSILTPAIIVLTIFFMLLGLSNAGISNFGVVALMSGYGVTFSAANIALTAFLGASAAGVLAGGYLADRTRRHGNVAAACFGINAVIITIIATINLPSVVLTAAMGLAGFLGGVIAPSRDMLVRNAAPAGAAGRAFGIVSTGFNFSGILSPLLFGWIMDQHLPHWVFGASVAFMVLTVLLALVTDRKPAEPTRA
jgi:MFS family permease